MQVVVSTSLVFMIFFSRCVYDFLVAFVPKVSAFHISQVTDSASKTLPFPAFLLYILWEVVPTTLVLVYFRRIPTNKVNLRTRFLNFFYEKCFGRERGNSSADSDSGMSPEQRFLFVKHHDDEDDEDDEDDYDDPILSPQYHQDASGAVEYCQPVNIYVDRIKKECFDDPQRYDSDTEIGWKAPHSSSSGAESYSLGRSFNGSRSHNSAQNEFYNYFVNPSALNYHRARQ
jgi:hypothetical protein